MRQTTYKTPHVWCDSKAAITVIQTTKNTEVSEDQCLEDLKLQEYYRNGVFTIDYVNTADNVADLFTTLRSKKRFLKLRSLLPFSTI